MLSANEAIFNEASVAYQGALVKSGYTFKLKYVPPVQNKAKAKRRRNILYQEALVKSIHSNLNMSLPFRMQL